MKNTQARAQRFNMTALTWTLLMLLLAQEAAGFWFICRYRDAQKAAKVANAAKERYNEYLSNPRATRAQVEACKQAWDVLRTNTFAAIAEFAQQVPGTSLTGPPNVKELTKDAIKEAIKEVLGDVAALQHEGMPLPLHDGQAGEFTRPSGVMAASLANATVPVGPVAAGQITELSLGYITPQDYDGALGEAPPWARLSGPLIFISGTFTDVAVENFQIGAQNPHAAANPGMLFTAEEIFVALLERPALLRGGFDNGFFSPELLQWVVDQEFDWDPERKTSLTMAQVGSLRITAVDVVAGTVSGDFYSIAGTGPLWDNGVFDGQVATESRLDAGGEGARAADDFELPQGNGLPWTIKLITAQLIQNSDSLANRALLEIYKDSGTGSPENAPPIAILEAIDSQTVATYFTGDQVQEYVVAPGQLTLPPGRYWVAAMGRADGSGTDQASFASANHPFIRLEQGRLLRPAEGVTQWTSVEEVDGIATDFAFAVDAEQPALVVPQELEISHSASGVVKLTWPKTGSDYYALQQATALSDTWTQVELPVLNLDGKRHVVVQLPANQTFYRLGTRSRKTFCEGEYDCFQSGTIYTAGQRTRIGFWNVSTCPGSTTLGDGSGWNLRALTCVCQ